MAGFVRQQAYTVVEESMIFGYWGRGGGYRDLGFYGLGDGEEDVDGE
jgi:hypothetical protein